MAAPDDQNTAIAELIELVKQGDEEKVKSVLDNRPQIKTQKNILNKILVAAGDAISANIIHSLLDGLNDNAALEIAINTANKHIINLVIDRVLQINPNIVKQKNVINLAKAAVEAARKDVILLLLDSGFNKNAALDIAINNGDRDVVNILVDQGAEVDEGLYFAVKANKMNIVTLLQERGANINTNRRNGNTPLHAAIMQKCDVSVVAFLIDKGADPNALTKNNKTSLELVDNILTGKNPPTATDNLTNIKALLRRSKLSNNVFECLQGLPDGFSGYWYQIKMFTLYAVLNTKRAMSGNVQYELGTEVKDLLPYDDVYLRKIEDGQIHSHFVQVKNTKKPESNMIKQDTFFTMLKSGKDMKEYVKKNDTIVKLFKKFNEITVSLLGDGVFGEYIYYTNTHFLADPSPCFTSVSTSKNDIFFDFGAKKWQINDWKYLHIEIKFVLLNLIRTPQYIENIDTELKNKFNYEIKTVDNFKIESIYEHSFEDSLSPIRDIADGGLQAIDKYLKSLENAKQKIKHASDAEHVKNLFPAECELPYYTGDVELFKGSAIIKVSEAIKSVHSDRELFSHFNKWDEVMVREKIESFVKHFCIFTDCPTSEQMDEMIAKEISNEFKYHNPKLFADHCVNYFSKWISDFKNARGNSFTDIDGKKMFNDIKTEIFKGISKSYIDDLQTHNIHFEHENKQILNFINKENNNKILHVITERARLHAINISQILKGFETETDFKYLDRVLFTNSELVFRTDDSVKDFLNAFSSSESNDFLIIEFADNAEECKNLYKVLDKISNIIKDNNRKKIIIIAKSDNRLATELKYIFKHDSYNGHLGFKDLTQESQGMILDRTINFHNSPKSPRMDRKLKDLLTISSACEVINEEILSMIITKKDDIKIGDTQAFYSDDYNTEYYIPRHMHHQIIDNSVLRNIDKHLFFVTGISKDQLTSKVYGQEEFINVWEEGTTPEFGIILRPEQGSDQTDTNEEIFNHISKTCNNIYWLEFHNEVIFFKGIKNIVKDAERPDIRVSDLSTTMLNKYSFNPEDLNNKVVIVPNHSGEGKSTMLTHLAHTMKNNGDKTGDIWIIRVNLKDYVDNQLDTGLNNINFSDVETSRAIDTLTKMIVQEDGKDIATQLERKLLKAALEGHGVIKVVLLFDGFDEICPDYKTKTCTLLKALKTSNVKQIWITTRVHVKRYLEEELETPAWIITPFTRNEQVQFLNRFWKWHLKNYNDPEETALSVDEIRIKILNSLRTCYENFCQHTGTACGLENLMEIVNGNMHSSLQTLQKAIDDKLDLSVCAEISIQEWRQSIRDRDEFSNVPLNIKMLAKNILFRNKWQISNLKNVGTFEIYNEFVESNIKIYHEKKSTTQSGNPADSDLASIARPNIRKMHRELAVKTLFPHSSYLPDLNICNEYDNIYEKLARIGLIKSYGNRIQFVHRSYAEYFFSEYLSVHLDNPHVQSELLIDVVINDDYQLIRTFFDAFLSKMPRYCSPQVIKEIMKRQNERAESILHLASLGEHKNISAFILNNTARQKDALGILINCEKGGPNALDLKAWEENEQVCDIIVEIVREYPNDFKDLTVKRDNEGHTVLNPSEWVGNKEACDIIKKAAMQHQDALKELIMKCDMRGQTALHVAACNNTVEVCDLIMNIVIGNFEDYKDLLFKCDIDGRTALVISVIAGNTDICKMILNAVKDSEDVLKKLMKISDMEGRTSIYLAALYNRREMLDMILDTVKVYPVVFKELMLMSGKEGLTALHLAAQMAHNQICRLFLNTVKEEPDTFVELIVKCDKDGRSILCTEEMYDNTEIFDMIMKAAKMHKEVLRRLVMVCDKEGRSALHITTLCGRKELCDIILDSVKDETDIFKDLVMKGDKEGNNILYISATNKMTEVCGLILEYVKEQSEVLRGVILMCDKEGSSILHVLAERGHGEMCSMIVGTVESHPDILQDFILNGDKVGSSALHIAAQGGQSEVCSAILGNIKRHPDILERLVQSGDRYGSTPLHLAAKAGHRGAYEAIVKQLNDRPEILNVLLSMGDAKGRTPPSYL